MKFVSKRLAHTSNNKKICLLIALCVAYFLYTVKPARNDPKVLQLLFKNNGPWNNSQYSSECDCRRTEKLTISKIESGNKYKVHSTQIGKPDYFVTEEELNKLKCDPFNSLRRGRNQKVIGVSLYGNKEMYYALLKPLAISTKKLYPGWVLRVHHDSSFKRASKCELECLVDEALGLPMDNVDFCDIEQLPGLPFERFSSTREQDYHSMFHNEWNASFVHGMMWRWLPIGDLFVDVMASRDSDSVVYQREVEAVNVWLKSSKVGHIMRDHPVHTASILGKE